MAGNTNSLHTCELSAARGIFFNESMYTKYNFLSIVETTLFCGSILDSENSEAIAEHAEKIEKMVRGRVILIGRFDQLRNDPYEIPCQGRVKIGPRHIQHHSGQFL